HAADDHARGNGDGAAGGHAAPSADLDDNSHRRRRRDRGRGHRRLALVALRSSREPRPVFSGDGGVPAGFRGATPDLWLPRADRSQHFSVQRAPALGHGAVRSGRPVRAIPHVPARDAAARVARHQQPRAAAGARAELLAGRWKRRRPEVKTEKPKQKSAIFRLLLSFLFLLFTSGCVFQQPARSVSEKPEHARSRTTSDPPKPSKYEFEEVSGVVIFPGLTVRRANPG